MSKEEAMARFYKEVLKELFSFSLRQELKSKRKTQNKVSPGFLTIARRLLQPQENWWEMETWQQGDKDQLFF